MKKIQFTLLLTLVIAAMLLNVGASNELNWYVIKNSEHKRPPLDNILSAVNGHNAVYLGEDEKVIYLTFDAGYENGNIEKILDVLKSHDVPAAFFVLENIVCKNSDLIKRMKDEGHLVCNHTAKHKNMALVKDENEFASELKRLENIYYECTGKEIDKFYRPPEGSFTVDNIDQAEKLGYKTVFWSFAYADWDNKAQMSTDEAYKKIMTHVHNGEIMLLHPTSATNAAILDRVVSDLESQGWRFGSLNELL